MAVPQSFDVPFRMYKDGVSSPAVVVGDAVLDRSIRAIIQTVPGERPYRPTFGSWVSTVIFAGMTEGAAFQAAAEVRRAVGDWERRVDIVDVLFELVNDNTISLTVIWRANGRPLDSSTTVQFRT